MSLSMYASTVGRQDWKESNGWTIALPKLNLHSFVEVEKGMAAGSTTDVEGRRTLTFEGHGGLRY